MPDIDFVDFKDVNPEDFLPVVNEKSLRTHLVDHDAFTSTSIKAWVNDKLEIDALDGCRVRAVYIDGALAGWCGIQPDDKGYELAIVISKKFWGYGISIFRTLMRWAKELGHKEIVFHLLDSRPEYKALNKMSTKVHKTELLGRHFTSYYVSVDAWGEE